MILANFLLTYHFKSLFFIQFQFILSEKNIKMSKQKSQILGLNGLRAIAAFAVLLYHYFGNYVSGGFLGVDMFFVISGFLITSLLIYEFEKNGKIDLKAFFLRRFRRIFPAIWTLVFLIIPIAYFINSDFLVNIKWQIIGAMTFSYNLLQIWMQNSYFDSFTPLLLKNLWTLAIEWQFYIFWAFLLIFLFKFKKSTIIIFTSFLICCGVFLMWFLSQNTDISRVYLGSDTHSFGLLIGALFAFFYPKAISLSPKELVFDDKDQNKTKIYLKGTISFLCLITIFVSFFIVDDSTKYPYAFVLVSFCCAFVIWSCFDDTNFLGFSKFIVKFLEFKALVWLGIRSYSIYLWHWPTYLLTSYVLGGNDIFLNAIISTILTLLMADFSYKFIETPMRKNGILNTINFVFSSIKTAPVKICFSCIMLFLTISPIFIFANLAPQKTELEKSIEDGKNELEIIEDSNLQISNLPISENENLQIPNLQNEKISIYNNCKLDNNLTNYMKFANLEKSKNKKNKKIKKQKNAKTVDLAIQTVQKDVNIYVIGDSITIAAAKYLKMGLKDALIDAQTSRQVSSGIDIIKQWKKDNEMPEYLVFALGTNGIFTKKQGDEIMEILGDKTKLILIYTYSSPPKKWLKSVNETIDYMAQNYPNQVKIANWSEVVKSNAKILHTDGVHPNIRGAKLFTNCIVETINNF